MSTEARDKVRKCSKSQVAIIARLTASSSTDTPATNQTLPGSGVSGAEGIETFTRCHQTNTCGNFATVDSLYAIRLKLHLANGRILCALTTAIPPTPTLQQQHNAAQASAGEQPGSSMLIGAPVDDVGAAAAQYLAGASTEAIDLYVARYANCYRGNTDVNRHAEEFLLEDSDLLGKILGSKCSKDPRQMPSAGAFGIDETSNEIDNIKSPAVCQGNSALMQELKKLSGGRRAGVADMPIGRHPPVADLKLVLYMTYQPCHHSGGRVPKDAMGRLSYASMQHPTSCSERLRDFFISTLKPNGVSLELVLADVYKAIWDEVCETLIFA